MIRVNKNKLNKKPKITIIKQKTKLNEKPKKDMIKIKQKEVQV